MASVDITNFSDIEQPFTNSFLNYFGAIQANSDTYAQAAIDENAAHRKWFEDYYWPELRKEYEARRAEEEKWRLLSNSLAVIQEAAALYFANKQYQAAKEALDHQINVWNTEKEWASRYQDLWFNSYKPLELSLLEEIEEEEEYTPQYDTAKDRILVDIRTEFALAREKLRRCFDPTCVGEICYNNKELAMQEARVAVGALDKAYRYEEAKADLKKAEIREIKYKLIGVGRGLLSDSLNALNSAAAAAETASTINPWSHLAAGVGGALGRFGQYAANRSTQAGVSASGLQLVGGYQTGISRSLYRPVQSETLGRFSIAPSIGGFVTSNTVYGDKGNIYGL